MNTETAKVIEIRKWLGGLKNIWGHTTPDDRKDSPVYAKDLDTGKKYCIVGLEETGGPVTFQLKKIE